MSNSQSEYAFKMGGHIVIVGASLAGLRAAEALRAEGFSGQLTLIGDEPYEPYDRTPLSKQVLLGWVPADHTVLPRQRAIDAEWRLGVRATGLNVKTKQVQLADGETMSFDRMLIATGTRARPWPNAAEAALEGVFTLRGRDDAQQMQQRLAAKPQQILIVGAGFLGSEIASVCRDLDLPVIVAERGSAPLVNALGGVVGKVAADVQRQHGVDLRCGITVIALEGDAHGRLCRAHLSDGTVLDTDMAVVALGAIRNSEWLNGSGLAAGYWGVACDAGCRAIDINGIVTDDIFVAGDIARFPHPLYQYQLIALEHWDNAVAQAEVAAHNMVCAPCERRPHLPIPAFWSMQFGINIKSVGVPSFSDQVVITQGSIEEHRFVAAYGYKGRITAAVTFNQSKWLDFYEEQVRAAGPFPPKMHGYDQPSELLPIPSAFPNPVLPTHRPTVALTGYAPDERRASFVQPLI